MLRTGARVTALEVDAESVSHLNRVFMDVENRLEVRLIDALEADWPEDITHIVSNLPYQISSPILERIQRHHAIFPLRGIALLVQDEFAERMAMIGGHANRGPLGHSLWLQFDVDLDSRVPPHSFSPAPRVHSRLVSLMPVNRLEINNIDNRLYRMVVSECFANRRRKLRTLLSKSPKRLNRIPGWHRTRWSNSIRQIPPQTLELRPENLTSVEWAELIEIISSE